MWLGRNTKIILTLETLRLSVFGRRKERNRKSCKVKTCFKKEPQTRSYADRAKKFNVPLLRLPQVFPQALRSS